MGIIPYYEIMEPLIERIGDYIAAHGLVAAGDRILLSLSAGKDSMFLLHVMMELRGVIGFDTAIFHLNHMMRGEESDRDQDFIASIARNLGMEHHIRRYDFNAGHGGASFEARARLVRYAMLDEIADACGYSVIATAHSRDDTIETILMRIFTGTGIHGLQGIPPRRGRIVRPILDVAAQEIYDYLAVKNIVWREDATNADVSHSRNYIRHEILPAVKKRFPMADGSLVALGEMAHDTMSLLDEMTSGQYHDAIDEREDALYVDPRRFISNYPLFSHLLAGMIRKHFSHYISRNMMRQIFSKFGIDRSNILLYEDKTICVEKRFFHGKYHLKISASSNQSAAPPEWEYRIDLTDGLEQHLELKEAGIAVAFRITNYDFFEKMRKNRGYIFVTLENGINSIYIRNRREGDRIRTENGTKRIKDLFIEKRIDRVNKERVPLLVTGNTIMACMPGLFLDIPNRVASDFLVDKNSKKVLAVFTNNTKG